MNKFWTRSSSKYTFNLKIESWSILLTHSDELSCYISGMETGSACFIDIGISYFCWCDCCVALIRMIWMHELDFRMACSGSLPLSVRRLTFRIESKFNGFWNRTNSFFFFLYHWFASVSSNAFNFELPTNWDKIKWMETWFRNLISP